jgi:histidyl-tRNA synthetase
MADYQAMAADLRAAGIRAEVYLGNPKNFGNQLKYADKRQSPVAIIQGDDEAARGVVQVKNLLLGAFAARYITDNEKWNMLTKSASVGVGETFSQFAQFEVSEQDLVSGVRNALASKAFFLDTQGSVVDQDGKVVIPAIFL